MFHTTRDAIEIMAAPVKRAIDLFTYSDHDPDYRGYSAGDYLLCAIFWSIPVTATAVTAALCLIENLPPLFK